MLSLKAHQFFGGQDWILTRPQAGLEVRFALENQQKNMSRPCFFKTFKFAFFPSDRKLSGDYGYCIKGGVVIPHEIRDSEIHRGEPVERIQTRNWASNPFRSQYSEDDEGRDLSSST